MFFNDKSLKFTPKQKEAMQLLNIEDTDSLLSYYPFRYEILEVNKDSKLFLFLTRIQEEVHRYAITYHRNIKAKGALTSILDMVPGIGEVRKKELLKKFGSLKKMKEASVEELSSVVTREVAEKLFEYLKEV